MKKILTWILSIAMVLTMMPVMGAQAKDPVRVIKLDKDMTLTEPVMVEKLGKNVVLDLNGYYTYLHRKPFSYILVLL